MDCTKPKLGISIMPEHAFLEAIIPLFKDDLIEVIEWSFDTILQSNQEPEWLALMLKEYGINNRLLGHGVYYSLLDANWGEKQEQWLKRLKQQMLLYNYTHITEHFGLMSSASAHNGFPLPVPLSNNVLRIGIDRLKRLQNAAQVDVGIENLALATNSSDILSHGNFLFKLVTPINGFIILDLHNIYCQSENFKIDIMTIINSFPLDLVKEIHISGGSWDNDPSLTRTIRRDTHDGEIPGIIFEILPAVLKSCPKLEFIIFEKLGSSFKTQTDIIDFRNDYKKLKAVIDNTTFTTKPRTWNIKKNVLEKPLIDIPLFQKQQILRKNIKSNNNDHGWEKDMWNIANKLYKKWNK